MLKILGYVKSFLEYNISGLLNYIKSNVLIELISKLKVYFFKFLILILDRVYLRVHPKTNFYFHLNKNYRTIFLIR